MSEYLDRCPTCNWKGSVIATLEQPVSRCENDDCRVSIYEREERRDLDGKTVDVPQCTVCGHVGGKVQEIGKGPDVEYLCPDCLNSEGEQ